MSYESGSLLSIGAGASLEQVLVLSDGRVATKLFAGKPVAQRDIINLSDWLMLAEGQNITVVLPLNKGVATPVAAPSVATPVAAPSVAAPSVPVATPVAAPSVAYPVGTMLRWIKDNQNKRVALVMKDYVLQVKEVIAGKITMNGYSVKRSSFKDFAEWKASLPDGGAITAEGAKSSAPTIEQKAKAPIKASTDTDYIAELATRYLVHSEIIQNTAPTVRLEQSRKGLISELERISKNVNIDNSNLGRIAQSAKYITYYADWMTRQINDIKNMAPQEASAVSYRFNNHYKQKLFAYKNGLKYEICTKNGMLALAPSAEGSKYRGNALMGESFSDLGIEMKADGKPRLEVSYYRRRIEL